MLRSYSFVILLVMSFYQVYAEELPPGLYELMEKHDCSEIVQDYDNSGDNIVEPLYVYGYLDGAKEDGILFWCETNEPEDEYHKYTLMVYTREENALRCPSIVTPSSAIGRLTLYKEPPYSLDISYFQFRIDEMVEDIDLTECVPAKERDNFIEIDYGESTAYIFYCDVGSGSWLRAWLH